MEDKHTCVLCGKQATEIIANIDNQNQRAKVCAGCFTVLMGPRPWHEPKKWIDADYAETLTWRLRRYVDFVLNLNSKSERSLSRKDLSLKQALDLQTEFFYKIQNKRYGQSQTTTR